LGNGVNVGAVYNVIKAQVIRDMDLLGLKPKLTRSIVGAPASPDTVLFKYQEFYFAKEGQVEVESIQYVDLRELNSPSA
jgi:DNA (cytosine-5)-methyltransferase 1